LPRQKTFDVARATRRAGKHRQILFIAHFNVLPLGQWRFCVAEQARGSFSLLTFTTKVYQFAVWYHRATVASRKYG
jgi:hypothetical protein